MMAILSLAGEAMNLSRLTELTALRSGSARELL